MRIATKPGLLALAVCSLGRPSEPLPPPEEAAAKVRLSQSYGRLPLHFEPNLGQAHPHVRFLTRAAGMTVLFADTEVVTVLSRPRPRDRDTVRRHTPLRELEQAVVRMKLAGAGKPREILGQQRLPGISNYFIGNDPRKWRTNLPHYARLKYKGLYPGVDLVCYGRERQLEYDFVVAPGADPHQIQLAWEGAEWVRLDPLGDLMVRTPLGELVQKRPRVYQEVGGERIEVASRYLLAPDSRASFELARYDRSRPLVIDPLVLVYSTYLGSGSADSGRAIAVDRQGAAYVAGYSCGTDFPLQSPYRLTLVGCDAFVTKLTPLGNALVYSTYLGGSFGAGESATGIAIDGIGAAYITGRTGSTDFPTQSPYQANLRGDYDAFVTKLAPAGNALLYSTYLGGSNFDSAAGIAVDGTNAAHVTGVTASSDFPTASAYYMATYQGGQSDAFVTTLVPAGNQLLYSIYLGGLGDDEALGIAVDGAGAAYVTGDTTSANFPTTSPFQSTPQGGTDAFVTKLAPAGGALLYSTYLGGKGTDGGQGIAVDGAGSAYVAGYTDSVNFPVSSPFQGTFQGGWWDVFVTKLTPRGDALGYSTYLGGSKDEHPGGVAVDGTGAAYVTGDTWSADFPTKSAFQSTYMAREDGFVAKVAPAGNALVYSTYLRGSYGALTPVDRGSGIVVDEVGAAYVTGETGSDDFPVQFPFQASRRGNQDAFVTKLLLCSYAVTGSSSFGAAGGSGSVSVAVSAGCAWTASKDVDWITFTSGGGGSGNGTVSFSLAMNAGSSARNGTITIGDQSFRVSQAGSAGPPVGPITVVNGASFSPGLASATWMTALGAGLATSARIWQASDFAGSQLPTRLDGVSVKVNGKAAYIYYVSPTQVNFLAPDDETVGAVAVEVLTSQGQTYSANVAKQPLSPAFFMFDPEGRKYVAAVHPDGTVLARAGLLPGLVTRPAKPGGVILLYGTGFGPTTPSRPTGEIVAEPAALATPGLVVRIGNVPATVQFAGLVGAGLYQFNVEVPPLADGDQPVVAELGGSRTQSTAFITVRNE